MRHILQMPDSSQHHHYTIGNQPHPTDYTLHFVIYFVTTFIIHPTEIFYKMFLQSYYKKVKCGKI